MGFTSRVERHKVFCREAGELNHVILGLLITCFPVYVDATTSPSGKEIDVFRR